MKPMLTFIFPNEELKQRFAAWMCDGGGEQEFMMTNENVSFDYHQGGGFIKDNVVVVTIAEDEDGEL